MTVNEYRNANPDEDALFILLEKEDGVGTWLKFLNPGLTDRETASLEEVGSYEIKSISPGSDGLTFVYVEKGQTTLYRYGMRHRGFAPGCQPMGGLYDRVGDAVGDENSPYYDIIRYTRKLRESEIRDYELEYIGEESYGI